MEDSTAPQVTPVFNVPTSAPAASSVVAPVATPAKKHSGFDNVLGFLGDFLLSRLNMGTPYHDARQNEKINQARLLDAQDPSQTYSTLGNLDPALAAKLQGQAVDDKRQAQTAQALADLRKQQEDLKAQANRKSYLDRAASMMQLGMGQAKPGKEEETYSTMRQLRLHSQELMSDPVLQEQFNNRYPEIWDPVVVSSSIGESVPVQAQWQQRLMKEQIDNQDAQAGDRIATTERGQDLDHQDRVSGQGVTMRGQNIRSSGSAAHRDAANRKTAARIAARPATARLKPTGAMITYLRQHPEKRDSFDGKFGVGMSKRILGN